MSVLEEAAALLYLGALHGRRGGYGESSRWPAFGTGSLSLACNWRTEAWR